MNELTQRHETIVRIDEGGPEGVFADDLQRCEPMKGREVLQACGGMYDAIIEGRVRFRTDPAFDEAVGGAAKKPVGDLWAWSRKASVGDVTPLIAATLALKPMPARGVPFVFTR